MSFAERFKQLQQQKKKRQEKSERAHERSQLRSHPQPVPASTPTSPPPKPAKPKKKQAKPRAPTKPAEPEIVFLPAGKDGKELTDEDLELLEPIIIAVLKYARTKKVKRLRWYDFARFFLALAPSLDKNLLNTLVEKGSVKKDDNDRYSLP